MPDNQERPADATLAITADKVWTGSGFASGLAILHSDGWIRQVLPKDELPPGTPVDDWGGVALVPGTVNAHGHSFQNLLKGYGDDRPFDRWRDDVLYPFAAALDRDAIYAGALFTFAEALLAGVTTIVDFFYIHDDGNENAEAVIRAARDIGISLVVARAFYDRDAATKAPDRFRESAEDAAARTKALARDHADDLVSVQPAPHSLHAASPATIRTALEVAHDLGVPCHLHLAEARYEVDQIRERYGTTPVRLLDREGLLDRRLVTVHAVWVDDEELDLVAAAGAGVVHCPGANAFLGDGIARVPEMLARGIAVALGPDGGCANNRQSVFDEMRMASLVAKARLTDGGAMDAATAFTLGTKAGADLLQVPTGDIAPGKRADLVALDLDDLSLFPPSQLERHIVNSMQPTAVAKVMVAGRLVVEDGSVVTVPLGEVRERVRSVTEAWERPA